jgi:hypothetical protein
MRKFVRKYATTGVSLAFLAAAIMYRAFVPVGSEIQQVLLYVLPAITIILLVLVQFTFREGPNTLLVPRIPGTRGETPLADYLVQIRGIFQDELSQLKVSTDRMQQEVSRLNFVIDELKQSGNRLQILSIVIGILATLLLAGVPNPLSLFFK